MADDVVGRGEDLNVSTHHVYPTFGPAHETDGGPDATCWCGPVAIQACPVCGGDGCGGCERLGWVHPAFSDDPDWPTVVLHWAPGMSREIVGAAYVTSPGA